MKPATRLAISLLLLVVCCGLGYWVTVWWEAGRRGRGASPSGASGAERPEAVVAMPVIKHGENGRLDWKLYLDQIELQAGGSIIGARGLREGLVYDASGAPGVRVTAQRVTGDATRRNFEVTGDVVVTSPKGIVITTDKVNWLNDQQELHCPGPVVMRSRGRVFVASTLDYFINTDLVRCPSQARVYSGNNRIVGQQLTYNVQTGIVDIVGGIQMVLNVKEAKQIMQELRKP